MSRKVEILQSFKLVVIDAEFETYQSHLEQAKVRDLRVVSATAGVTADVPQVDLVLGQPDQVRRYIDQGAQPIWYQSTWAGVDGLFGGTLPDGLTVTGLKGVFGPKISEYVMAYVLEHHRDVIGRWRNQCEGIWRPDPAGELAGKQLVIVGAGDIARRVAQTAGFFGMQVVGVSRSGSPQPEYAEVYPSDAVSLAVANADYVVGLLPSTAETRHFFDAEVFKAMPAKSLLINAGRGSAVDEDALLLALREGSIGGAVLDVFHHEPLPADHAFWKLSNVRITSHTAGITTPAVVVDLFLDNLQRLRAGQPLQHVVDLELGY